MGRRVGRREAVVAREGRISESGSAEFARVSLLPSSTSPWLRSALSIDPVLAPELFLSSLGVPPGWFDDATRSPKRRGRPAAHSRPGSLPPLAHSRTVLLGWRATIKIPRVQSFCLGVRVSVCGASLASGAIVKCRAEYCLPCLSHNRFKSSLTCSLFPPAYCK